VEGNSEHSFVRLPKLRRRSPTVRAGIRNRVKKKEDENESQRHKMRRFNVQENSVRKNSTDNRSFSQGERSRGNLCLQRRKNAEGGIDAAKTEQEGKRRDPRLRKEDF